MSKHISMFSVPVVAAIKDTELKRKEKGDEIAIYI